MSTTASCRGEIIESGSDTAAVLEVVDAARDGAARLASPRRMAGRRWMARAGWTGDWQLFVPTAAYLYDVAGFS